MKMSYEHKFDTHLSHHLHYQLLFFTFLCLYGARFFISFFNKTKFTDLNLRIA